MRSAKHAAKGEAALPVIDTRRGLLLAGADTALYRAFLLEYPKDETISRLRAALDAGHTQEAALLAHTLKGLAAQLGLDEVSAAARALEDALRQGGPVSACARRVFAAHERAVLAIARLSAASGLPPAF
ncbi:MAG: Hpt domain-containing protein [Clostridia bacterium]|nr:Hpt domain-containing protein [Clostridia bacterium]